MANINMVNMNTLFRKGYLLAGVIIAANMFAVNEMKAMKDKTTTTKSNTSKLMKDGKLTGKGKELLKMNMKPDYFKGIKRKKSGEQSFFDKVLSYENAINLVGGTVSSIANNYFKLWDYNPGWYRQFGCLGWRSKRFLNGVLQFEVNFNLGRGAFWSIPHIINLYIIKRSKGEKKDNDFSWVGFFFSDILRGFTSMPLTFHISKFNFSISISLDSIIWWGIIDNILKLSGKKKGKKENKEEGGEELIDINEKEKVEKKEEKIEDKKKPKIDIPKVEEPKVEIIKENLKPEEKKEEEKLNNENPGKTTN